MQSLLRSSVVLMLAWLAIASQGHARPPMPHQAPAMSLGAVNCASSTCHGSTIPWHSSNVLQNEYTTWIRLDPHSQAYNTLLNEDSKRIAKNLGLKEPAHEAKICLDCHAHNPAPNRRGERFILSEGVTCESCHGPSEKWIASHTVKDVRHADNIRNGLYPTSRPADQARLCLSCHFGDESRFVTHRIMGAGHPRMSFEISTFAALEPAHYRVDRDYIDRKGANNAVQLWAIGQVIAAQTFLETLADPKRSRDGMFPELVLFDCHSCHHSMTDKRWTPRLGLPPGVVRLNDSSLLMVRSLTLALNAPASKSFDETVARLHKAAIGSQGPANAGMQSQTIEQIAVELSKMMDRLIPVLEKTRFDQAAQRKLLLALIDETKTPSYADYAGAEQAYMALVGLSNGLAKNGGLKITDPMKQSFERLRGLLGDEDRYRGGRFIEELGVLRAAVMAHSGASK